jgi:uncharacterized protein (DUF433 family)
MATTEKADLSRITVIPGQRSGQPCIRGFRVTVWDVLDMLASGMTEGDILNDYPYLEKADFPAVYSYASQAGRERRVRCRPRSSDSIIVITALPRLKTSCGGMRFGFRNWSVPRDRS